MSHLQASVGAYGANRRADVRIVQRLLVAHHVSPGPIDGLCGRLTMGAILHFQRSFMARPDGRVDPNGPTLRHLNGLMHPAVASGSSSSPTAARPQAMAARPQANSPPRPSAAPNRSSPRPVPAPVAPAVVGANYKQRLPLPERGTINVGLQSPSNREMQRLLGEPRNSYGQDCRSPTNERIKAVLDSVQFGSTLVHGIRPAVASLRHVIADIQREQPDLYRHLGSAGMMCCRHQRGSNTAVSNHSWGTAIDVAIDGVAEPWGERDVWLGLSLISPIFNRHGWYWGAGYRRSTDCHHFECGSALLSTFSI